MSDIAARVNHVWKKFHRGEIHDSLRDLVPAVAKRLAGRAPRRDELAEGDFWALKDVSFQVKRGEVLGIIGLGRGGQVYAVEDPLQDHQAQPRQHPRKWPPSCPDRSGHEPRPMLKLNKAVWTLPPAP